MMKRSLVAELLRAIGSSNPALREKGADEVTDVHRGLPPEVVHELVLALVAARDNETVSACQEAQLNALCELSAWHRFDRSFLRPLLRLQDQELSPTQEDEIAELFSES
jgi:hypothetical protein